MNLVKIEGKLYMIVKPAKYLMNSTYLRSIYESKRQLAVEVLSGRLVIIKEDQIVEPANDCVVSLTFNSDKVRFWYRRPDGTYKPLSQDLDVALIQLDDEDDAGNEGGTIVSKQVPATVYWGESYSLFKKRVTELYKQHIS